MSLSIDTSNRIIMNGQQTGLAVVQRKSGTVVYTPETASTRYAEHKMPHERYSLTHEVPASGAAGKQLFEADVAELLQRI